MTYRKIKNIKYEDYEIERARKCKGFHPDLENNEISEKMIIHDSDILFFISTHVSNEYF